jgi:hypothetical protein
MKKIILFIILFATSMLGTTVAQNMVPVGVSPADELGIARIGTVCPTFSWTAIDWTETYRVEVFPAGDSWIRTHDEIAASTPNQPS